MASRVNSDVMLVGSLPATTAEEALREIGPLFGDLCFALPDGETGERILWVIREAYWLWHPHPDIETTNEPKKTWPGLPEWAPGDFFSNFWQFRVRPGVSDLLLERWPRIDDAIASYPIFRSLREEGVIPGDVRFQVGLPFPASAIGWFFRANFDGDYEVVEPAFEDLVHREMQRLLETVPADDLAIQWDVCFEVLDLEGLFQWTSPEGAWERYAGPVGRLSRSIPEDVLLGYHLCYGTFPEWPMREADDMGLIVRMANTAVESSGRTVDWLHLAGPRPLRSDDDAFFRPLQELRPGDARVFLGLAMPHDGVDGLKLREATARRHFSDFGVANYCGFGRQPGVDWQATLRDHRELVDAFRH